MPSPVTSTDFDNQSFSGKLCDLFRQKILNNDKLSDFLGWFLDSSGYPSASFITDIIGIVQPIGSLVLAPMDIGLDSEEYVVCSGQAISRTTYARLFNLIGTSFGSGDGSTTFNVPDLRDKFIVGSSASKTAGSSGGSDSTTVDLDHRHVFGDHYNTNDDGRFIKDTSTTLRSSPASVTEIHGNTGAPGSATITEGNFVTDLPTVDLSATNIPTIPSYFAAVFYIKANFRYRGVTL